MNDVRDLLADPRGWRAAKRRREAEVINMVQDGVRRGDFDQFNEGLGQLGFMHGWRRAMRAIARLNVSPPDSFRKKVLKHWILNGDHFRDEVGYDLALVDALRILLPTYQGPSLRLWRGDGARNCRRRAYGASWSSQFEVADEFARGIWRIAQGGSVVLETDVPPDAIICIVEGGDDHYGEKEVLVDRRRLTKVRVIARYEQLARHELREQQLCEELT